MIRRRIFHALAAGCLTGLIALSVSWELWLAPLRPGGSWMVLKALPLLAPLFGVLHGRIHTFQWASMLVLAYFTEGCMRAYADDGLSAVLAGVEIALSLGFVAAAVAYIRTAAGPRSGTPAPRARAR